MGRSADEAMEDQVFTIWTRIDPARVVAASVWFSAHRGSGLSVANLYRDCRDCRDCRDWAARGEWVDVIQTIDWNAIPRLLDQLPSFALADTAVLTRDDLAPSPQAYYCERHGLFNPTRLGCLACSQPWLYRDLPGVPERLRNPWREG